MPFRAFEVCGKLLAALLPQGRKRGDGNDQRPVFGNRLLEHTAEFVEFRGGSVLQFIEGDKKTCVPGHRRGHG
ncbi:MAG: hypothetical protein ACTIBZ_02130 [Corynebacterium variabile]|uniref:hypothetical protein n=1 Tax=Corynebacterium variabile TaxID=1727 RepID=UPI0005A199C0|nr:hypothetical protein [Corynebacterium variabile]